MLKARFSLGRRIDTETILCSVLHADAMALVAQNEDDLQRGRYRLRRVFKESTEDFRTKNELWPF